VTVRAEALSSANLVRVTDRAGVSVGSGCFVVSPTEAHCPVPRAAEVRVDLAGGDDRAQYRARQPGFVRLGADTDSLIAGTRETAGQSLEPVTYSGGSGRDLINYINAPRGVSVTPEDGLANDGPRLERENVSADFETFVGSNFADVPLFGTPNADVIFGVGGDDQIAGGGAGDTFVTSGLDGGDDYHGGPGTDTVDYGGRTEGLVVDLDNVDDDGEAGENDNVRSNVEHVLGGSGADTIDSLGAFSLLDGRGGGDTLLGGAGPDTLIGGEGDDNLDGGSENDVFSMGAAPDGADTVRGGSGLDTVSYNQRARTVTATLNHKGADDGEAGEGDELVGSNEFIFGGAGGDTITAPAGSKAAHHLFGLGGKDTINGADGPDTIDGGSEVDTIAAFGDNDVIAARDGFSDIIGCGSGIGDTATLDASDITGGCENRDVGRLRLAPKALQAEAGKVAPVRLSWRHPRSWRKLDKVELRLTRNGVPVGEVTIRPQGERMSDDGGVRLVRRQSRLTRNGKTVTARLALRLDDSLVGQTLQAEVEATDRRGARQLERDAGTVRVAR
jgi:Ca2+-binding RTX toxin-like protein